MHANRRWTATLNITKSNYHWVFGNGANLDFSTVPASSSSYSYLIGTEEGCASVSDATSGNLLFYTDGISVWDSVNTKRVGLGSVNNFDLLGNSSSTQSSIIVPDPGNDLQYYIFTADGDLPGGGTHNHVNFSRINVSSWLSTSPSPVPNAPNSGYSPTERVTAIQHPNCVDYWVITVVQEGPSANATPAPGVLRLFSVKKNSVGSSDVSWVSDTSLGFNIGESGYLKASPSGSQIAIADTGTQQVLVIPFTPATGIFSISGSPGLVKIPVPINGPAAPWMPAGHARIAYGVAFSPNERFLYYSVWGSQGTGSLHDSYVFQVDLTAPLAASAPIITVANTPYYGVGALQLGDDGRIYVAMPFSTPSMLGIINSPDLSACDPNHSVAITGTCRLGLPNLISSPCSQGCAEIGAEVDIYLSKSCSHKKNHLESCSGGALPCPCGSDPTHSEGECKTIDIPKAEPCISVSWGDSKCDCMETDDTEILCITVCNCYSNVTFSNFSIASVYVTTETGNAVPPLPDGTASVEVFPRGPICFGDIGPCKKEGPSCVSRQVVLIARGAKGGAYNLKVGGICFDVVLHYDQKACFRMNLCADR